MTYIKIPHCNQQHYVCIEDRKVYLEAKTPWSDTAKLPFKFNTATQCYEITRGNVLYQYSVPYIDKIIKSHEEKYMKRTVTIEVPNVLRGPVKVVQSKVDRLSDVLDKVSELHLMYANETGKAVQIDRYTAEMSALKGWNVKVHCYTEEPFDIKNMSDKVIADMVRNQL